MWSGSTSTRPTMPLVLSVHEKTQMQALDRTHPMLPLRPGQVERRTHDDTRHGATNLYAAFNLATGEVLGRITRRHRATEFRQFLAQIDRATSGRPRAAPDRRQQQYAHDPRQFGTSWPPIPAFTCISRRPARRGLNAVETWFGQLERRALRRGIFTSVTEAARSHSPLHRDAQHPRRQTLPMDHVSPHHSRRREPCQRSPAHRPFPHGTLAGSQAESGTPIYSPHHLTAIERYSRVMSCKSFFSWSSPGCSLIPAETAFWSFSRYWPFACELSHSPPRPCQALASKHMVGI